MRGSRPRCPSCRCSRTGRGLIQAPTAHSTDRQPSLLPDLVSALEHVIVGADDNPRARGLAGGLLSYVYNPLDIIPDDGPLGLVDDAFICALGIEELKKAGHITVDPFIQGACDLAFALVPILDPKLRDALSRFVADLVATTTRQVSMGVFQGGIDG